MTGEAASRDKWRGECVAPASGGARNKPAEVPGTAPAASDDAGRRGGARIRRMWRLVSLLLVTGLSLLPGGQLPQDLPDSSDKIFHALAFAWLGLLGALPARGRRAAWGAAAALFLFGALIECAQPWVGRSFSLKDMTANGLGAAAGTFLGCRLASRRPARSGR